MNFFIDLGLKNLQFSSNKTTFPEIFKDFVTEKGISASGFSVMRNGVAIANTSIPMEGDEIVINVSNKGALEILKDLSSDLFVTSLQTMITEKENYLSSLTKEQEKLISDLNDYLSKEDRYEASLQSLENQLRVISLKTRKALLRNVAGFSQDLKNFEEEGGYEGTDILANVVMSFLRAQNELERFNASEESDYVVEGTSVNLIKASMKSLVEEDPYVLNLQNQVEVYQNKINFVEIDLELLEEFLTQVEGREEVEGDK